MLHTCDTIPKNLVDGNKSTLRVFAGRMTEFQKTRSNTNNQWQPPMRMMGQFPESE